MLTRVAIGKMTLRVPDDVGVRLEIKRVAAGFDHEGMVKRDDAWYSKNWDTRHAQAAHQGGDGLRGSGAEAVDAVKQ